MKGEEKGAANERRQVRKERVEEGVYQELEAVVVGGPLYTAIEEKSVMEMDGKISNNYSI